MDRGAAAGADAAGHAASAEPVIVEAQAAADDDRRCPEREDSAAVSGFVGKPALANAAEACRTIAAEAGRIEGHVPVEVHDPDARALKDCPKAVATAAIRAGAAPGGRRKRSVAENVNEAVRAEEGRAAHCIAAVALARSAGAAGPAEAVRNESSGCHMSN